MKVIATNRCSVLKVVSVQELVSHYVLIHRPSPTHQPFIGCAKCSFVVSQKGTSGEVCLHVLGECFYICKESCLKSFAACGSCVKSDKLPQVMSLELVLAWSENW